MQNHLNLWSLKVENNNYLITIIGWGFCDIQNNQGRGKSYIILDITKTESNNYCFIIHSTKKKNAFANDVVYL